MRAKIAVAAMLGSVLGLSGLALAFGGTVAHADEATSIEAGGSFAFRTANGILPTWERAGLRLTAVSPASSLTNTVTSTVLVNLPVVAQDGSTTYAAGGFRIANPSTGGAVLCASPAVDTKARVVDCVTSDGRNLGIFTIQSITKRRTIVGSSTTTRIAQGMVLRIANQRVADDLNRVLGVSVFSPSVTVANADLTVTSSTRR